MSFLRHILQFFMVRSRAKRVEDHFCTQVLEIKKNTNEIHRLTVDHDTEWFKGNGRRARPT